MFAAGRVRTRHLAQIVACVLACAATRDARAQIHSEFPALARPFTPESDLCDPARLAERLLDRGYDFEAVGIRFSHAIVPGEGSPRLSSGFLGGRAEASALLGRYSLGADATEDGHSQVDGREYPVRLHADAVVPEAFLSARAVLGFDDDGYAGMDLALESQPLVIPVPGSDAFPADLTLRSWGWVRVRKLEALEDPVLNPALAIALMGLPVVGGQAPIALSFQSDLASDLLPSSFGMLQLGWFQNPPRAKVRRRGDPPPSRLKRNLFFYGSYAFPMDDRTIARLALAGGMSFHLAPGVSHGQR